MSGIYRDECNKKARQQPGFSFCKRQKLKLPLAFAHGLKALHTDFDLFGYAIDLCPQWTEVWVKDPWINIVGMADRTPRHRVFSTDFTGF
jgi:hypothetical protein